MCKREEIAAQRKQPLCCVERQAESMHGEIPPLLIVNADCLQVLRGCDHLGRQPDTTLQGP